MAYDSDSSTDDLIAEPMSEDASGNSAGGGGSTDRDTTEGAAQTRKATAAPDAPADLPPLARLAGAFLLAAALFAVAATVAFVSFGRHNPWGWSFVTLGLLLLAGWFVGRRQGERVQRDEFARQRALVGANAVTSVLLLLVLLVGVNYIAARRHKTFDLTSNRINSLADQTVQVLNRLPAPVTLTYVYAGRQPEPMASSLLNAYKNTSDKVRVEYLNASVEPARFMGLNLRQFSGSPLLLAQLQTNAKGKAGTATRQEVTDISEAGVTSALLKIVEAKPQVVYFLTGHGEAPLTGSPSPDNPQAGDPRALSSVKGDLEAQNYVMKTVSLLGPQATIPKDAAALIVAGPQNDLAPNEAKLLSAYVAGKGHLVLLLNLTPAPLARWKSLARSLGIEVLDGMVLEFDSDRSFQRPDVPVGVVSDSSRHPLLRGVPANSAVVLPGSLALRQTSPLPAGVTVTPLFQTSDQSRIQPLQPNGKGQVGPFVLAAAIERAAPEGTTGGGAGGAGMRAFVTGNGNFESDAFATPQFSNKSLMLAAVNWVVGADALVSIPPKPPVTNTLSMPAPVQRLATIYSLFALPILVLITGTVVWWKRR